MNKLIITKDNLKNFTVRDVKDYDACPDALRYLIKRYGDKSFNLPLMKKEFLDMIENDNKSIWIIKFLLELLLPKFQIEFYESCLEDSIYLLANKKLAKECEKAISSIKKGSSFKTDLLKKTISSNREQINSLESYMLPSSERGILFYQIYICQSLLSIIEQNDKSQAQSIEEALSKIAEAQTVIALNDFSNNNKIKNIAVKLINYVGFFEN